MSAPNKKKHGNRAIYYENPDVRLKYEGDVKDGLRSGNGVCYLRDGSRGSIS